MYKIDRRGGEGGGVQKSFSRTDPIFTTYKVEKDDVKIFFVKYQFVLRIRQVKQNARSSYCWVIDDNCLKICTLIIIKV